MAAKCPKCEFENPPDTIFCGKCGTRIRGYVPDSPESETSAQDSKKPFAGLKGKISVTRTLETTPEELGKGKLFAGRFELIEELGAGGMGIVYRAYDKEVGEEIALKVLHPEIARDERTVDRFRNEIKLARRISHRHVCRMYELHQEGKQLFITMECVSGRDLKALIKEVGALSAGKAVSIAEQVAEGLAEAHDLGIVHRDLKPQNIMVDKEGLAKIMDFGIARSLRSAGMTAEGMIIGTPEYMAPEQVGGLEADQRTDIYALGAILFEMVTGRVPFEGDSPMSVAYKHKNEIPLPPRELNAEVPEPFNQLILRCLEKAKEDRYQSAAELLADLIRIEEGLPISERTILKASPTSRISREKPRGFKRFRIPAIIAGVLAVAAAVIFRTAFYKPIPPAAAKIPNSIAIISFTNLTGEQDLDIWSRGIPEGLITNLENTGYFRVTTWERMLDLLKEMGKKDVEYIDSDLGFELCRRAGIESLITGTMRKAGDIFALDVRILDAETKELRKSTASQGQGEESILSSQLDELSRAIAEGLGTSKEKIEQAHFQMAEMRTASPEAYRFFIIGQDRNAQLDAEKAAENFEKATQIDPQFAVAYDGLAWAYYMSGKQNEGRKALAKAMELSGQASEKDRLIIQSSYFFWVERNFEKAATIMEEAVLKYPDDKRIHGNLALSYDFIGRSADAIKEYQEALRLDPDYGPAFNGLGTVYARTGEFEKAVEALKKYIALTPGEPNPWDSLGWAYIKMGKVDEAIASYQEALKIMPDFEPSITALSYLYAFKEDYPQALDSIDRYLSLNLSPENRAEAYLWKGFCLHWLGRFRKSMETYRQAEEASLTADWSDKPYLFLLRFYLYFDRGEFDAARQSIQKYVAFRVNQDPKREVYYTARIGDFLEGLCYIKEDRLEVARAKLEAMNRALDELSGRQKQLLMEDIFSLQTEIHLLEGSVEEALAEAEKIVDNLGILPVGRFSFFYRSSHNWPPYRELRARAYTKKGDIDRAIAEYERLTSPDPIKANPLIHPRYYYELGKLYEEKGVKDKARGAYHRYLELWKDADPGIAEVEDARKRLARFTSAAQ